MADEQSNINELRAEMKKLVKAFDEAEDRDELLRTAPDLDGIFKILRWNMKDEQIIEEKKAGELRELLPRIGYVLQQLRKARLSSVPAEPKQQQPAKTKKKMPSVSDCNPFKSRSSSPSHDQDKQQGDDDQGAALASVEDVKKQIIAILGSATGAGEVEYYEWTTSYVDESRIYGWDEEANEVVDALVGPRPPADQADKKDDRSAADQENNKIKAPAKAEEEPLLRAAGIVGIHGSGKTALAQKVFVHDRIKDAFPLRLWVCVGPPDHEDRPGLLYRMLDNLGLDTAKVEEIVNNSDAVKKWSILDTAKVEEIVDAVKNQRFSLDTATVEEYVEEIVKKLTSLGNEEIVEGIVKNHDAVKKLSSLDKAKVEEIVKNISNNSDDVKKFDDVIKKKINESKIGVLLFILHVTLYKTGYLIVFDDIRAYGGKDGSGKDGWYSNLTLQPPKEGEWFERLAYGLPKVKKSAVLVTCRKEDYARVMVRTGRVFRPPKLGVTEGWKLFEREYNEAKKEAKKKEAKKKEGGGTSSGSSEDKEEEEDKLYKELTEMKEKIVEKCLGLPVAIVEAAKGFAKLKSLPDDPPEAKPAAETVTSKTEPAAQDEDHKDDQSA